MLKTFIITAFINLLIISTGLSQTEKGARLIGGGGYFNLKDNFGFRLSPDYGQFIIDKLAVGASSTIAYFDNRHQNKNLHVSIGPFIRYYLGSSSNRLLLLGNLGVGSSGRIDRHSSYSERVFNAGFRIGFVHFLIPQVGFEAVLNYRNNWALRDNYDELFISLGFQIHLPSKKSNFKNSKV